MRVAALGCVMVVCAAAAFPILAAEERPAAFKIIVNASNSAMSLTKEETAMLFLKRKTQWEGKTPIVPVDLPASSPVREVFSREVLGRTASTVESYWMKQIYSGSQVPPVTLRSESEVVEYVSQHPGAIGYVSASQGLGEDVRAVSLGAR